MARAPAPVGARPAEIVPGTADAVEAVPRTEQTTRFLVASGIVEQNQEKNSGQQQQQGQATVPATPDNRSQIVKRLLDAPNLPAFVHDLVTTQAVVVVGTEAAGFLLEAS